MKTPCEGASSPTEFQDIQQTRAKTIITYVQEIETTLYRHLREAFGCEDAEIPCGGASVALAHILATNFHIPIGLDLQGEHIEIHTGIFDPADDPNRLDNMTEHSFVCYYTGAGTVIFFDIVLFSLIKASRQIVIAEYPENDLHMALTHNHYICPIDCNHPNLMEAPYFQAFGTREIIEATIGNAQAELNDWRGIAPRYSIGKTITVYSDRYKIPPVIRWFAPRWNPDSMAPPSKILDKYRKALDF